MFFVSAQDSVVFPLKVGRGNGGCYGGIGDGGNSLTSIKLKSGGWKW